LQIFTHATVHRTSGVFILVAKVGFVLNTKSPVPVSSLISPANCAEVVEANRERLFRFVASVAFESGSVKVFSVPVGQVNFVNPFPVPQKVEAIICVRSAVPSNKLPYILLAVCNAVAVPAFPVMFVWSPVLVPDRLERFVRSESVTYLLFKMLVISPVSRTTAPVSPLTLNTWSV